MSKDSQVVKYGNIDTLQNYVNNPNVEKLDLAKAVFAPKDRNDALKIEDQKKFYGLKANNGILTYKDEKGQDKPYNNGKELRDLSEKFEKIKIGLAEKYGKSFIAKSSAEKIDDIGGKHLDNLTKIIGKEKIKAQLAGDEATLQAQPEDKKAEMQARIEASKSKSYVASLNKFENAIKDFQEIEKTLAQEKTYAYASKVSIDGAKPSKDEINKGLASVLLDPTRVKDKGDILIEFETKGTKNVVQLKLNREDFEKIKNNVQKDSLKKGNYESLDPPERTKVAENIGKDLKGKVDINVKDGEIKASTALKANINKAFNKISDAITKPSSPPITRHKFSAQPSVTTRERSERVVTKPSAIPRSASEPTKTTRSQSMEEVKKTNSAPSLPSRERNRKLKPRVVNSESPTLLKSTRSQSAPILASKPPVSNVAPKAPEVSKEQSPVHTRRAAPPPLPTARQTQGNTVPRASSDPSNKGAPQTQVNAPKQTQSEPSSPSSKPMPIMPTRDMQVFKKYQGVLQDNVSQKPLNHSKIDSPTTGVGGPRPTTSKGRT